MKTVWWMVLGMALLGCGRVARTVLDSEPAGRALVERPLQRVLAHGDGPEAFSRAKLDEVRRRTRGDLPVLLYALCAGVLGAAWARRKGTAPGLRVMPLAAVLAAAVAGAYVLADQLRLAARAAQEGLFTEPAAARSRRFFGDGIELAARVNRHVPEGARFMVTDFAAAPDVVRVGYLSFPRRMFMPPRSDLRIGSDALRRLLRQRPDALEWCAEAGITHAVDLRRLAAADDPAAVVDLAHPD